MTPFCVDLPETSRECSLRLLIWLPFDRSFIFEWVSLGNEEKMFSYGTCGPKHVLDNLPHKLNIMFVSSNCRRSCCVVKHDTYFCCILWISFWCSQLLPLRISFASWNSTATSKWSAVNSKSQQWRANVWINKTDEICGNGYLWFVYLYVPNIYLSYSHGVQKHVWPCPMLKKVVGCHNFNHFICCRFGNLEWVGV